MLATSGAGHINPEVPKMKFSISESSFAVQLPVSSGVRNASFWSTLKAIWRKRTRTHLVTILFCIFGLTPGFTHAGLITLDPSEISMLRALVIKDAEAKTLFQSINKVAIAALEDKPQPIEQAVYEGTLITDPNRIRSSVGFRDMHKAEALAWVWSITGDDRFLKKASEFILAWARKNKSDGNPINETQFEPMVEAYDLVRGEISSDEVLLIDSWLQDKALKLSQSKSGLYGNWQSHRLKMIGLIANTINDAHLKVFAYDGFRKHIKDSFVAEGASIDFKRRDAINYHLYAVQPLLTLACVAQNHGESLFTYTSSSGSSLKKAVEFIRPYALGEKTHVDFANSIVEFDRIRANAGEKKYVPHVWNPVESVDTFIEAGCVDQEYDQLATIVAGKPSKRFLKWRAVLNASMIKKEQSITN